MTTKSDFNEENPSELARVLLDYLEQIEQQQGEEVRTAKEKDNI